MVFWIHLSFWPFYYLLTVLLLSLVRPFGKISENFGTNIEAEYRLFCCLASRAQHHIFQVQSASVNQGDGTGSSGLAPPQRSTAFRGSLCSFGCFTKRSALH